MDPLTLEVVQHSLAGIAEEMGATLRRTARSPNITEREDASCALTTPAGEMCAQAEHIPVHLGAMPASVAAALEEFPDIALSGCFCRICAISLRARLDFCPLV